MLAREAVIFETRHFREFFNGFYPLLCEFTYRWTGDQLASEDIVTDSFVKVWAKRKQLNDERELKAYLYRTAYNASLRWLEQKHREGRHIQSWSKLSGTQPETFQLALIEADILEELYQAIAKLPTQCRNIFTLLYVDGKTVRETATEMKLTISTVNNQKSRGVKLLREITGYASRVILAMLATGL